MSGAEPAVPTVEDRLREWAAQSPLCVVTAAEWEFVAAVRRAAAGGVGYGWMRQIVEWEWEAKAREAKAR